MQDRSIVINAFPADFAPDTPYLECAMAEHLVKRAKLGMAACKFSELSIDEQRLVVKRAQELKAKKRERAT